MEERVKAFVRDRYGPPSVLRLDDVDVPSVTPEAVLVRVRATSVNAWDWHMLRGTPYLARMSEGLRQPKTRVLGLDVAGVVEAVGENVTHLAPGDRAYGSRVGAFAEYVSGRQIAPMPRGLTFEEAAAVPTAGQTALQAVRDVGGLQPGQRVLVNGAGGGVGTFAVQIAAALGGEVTAVTRSANADLVRALGAGRVIDYEHADFARDGERYDLVVDAGGNRALSDMRRVLTRGGAVVVVAPARGQWLGPVLRMAGIALHRRFGGQQVRSFYATPSRERLTALTELIERGQVRPVVDRTYQFEELPDAVRHLESGHPTGKIVVTV
jgi:NADPH:quinone reductase-like Zn-dependent oxidoreductase